jgi:hypothetical protein
MKDTTKEKEKKEKKNDHDTLDTRRTDEVDLPVIPASESTEVSTQSTRFITESKTQWLKHNSHRNDGRGWAPLFAGSFASALYSRHCRFMWHVALVVGFWFVMMDPDDVDNDFVL